MTEAPIQPPPAPREGADAGARPDLWLGRQLWRRRVHRAGVATAGATAVLRPAGPALPLLATLLERRSAAIAHLAGDGDAGSTLSAWVTRHGNGLPATPIVMPTQRIEARAEDDDGARHHRATSARTTAPTTRDSPPLVAAVIQRRAVATRASAPSSVARAIPAAPAMIATTQPTPRAVSAVPAARPTSAMPMTPPVPAVADATLDVPTDSATQPEPRVALGPTRVGAPRRFAGGVAPTLDGLPTPIRGSVRLVGAPLLPAAAFAREQPRTTAEPGQPAFDAAISTLAEPPSMSDPRADLAAAHSLAGATPDIARDRLVVPPPGASVPRAIVVVPIAIPTPTAPGHAPVTSPSASSSTVAPASPPLPPPPLPPLLPLVRAAVTSSAVVASSRPRGGMPLALPVTAPPARPRGSEAELIAPPHGLALAQRREPPRSLQTMASAAPPSTTSAADARTSRERSKLGAPEIGRVAERVYQLLVDRLAQERQRRGV